MRSVGVELLVIESLQARARDLDGHLSSSIWHEAHQTDSAAIIDL
jgi:hypothetical protein